MKSVFRPSIDQMAGYVPGEQPQETGWVKLNTNENPYPPSPRVVEAIREAATSRLNVYPDPLSRSFRRAAARLFDVDPDWVMPANGSDEVLTVITRSFCDADQLIAYPYPSYVLYESLAQIQGCKVTRLRLNSQWQWDPAEAAALKQQTRIFYVPNPNSPTGNLWSPGQLVELLPAHGVLVLDEAYGDFVAEPHRGQLLRQPEFDNRLIVTRTLSKSYSLAGIRFGFAVAHPDLISGMQKAKDSYNCDAVSIAAATAAIEDQEWMLQNRARILTTRQRLADALPGLGFQVQPSEANFLWSTHQSAKHREIYEQLKQRRILVRFMQFPNAGANGETIDGLRITIGTDPEVDTLLHALTEIVQQL
ncbi:MAG: histidinol-phosphate transaminase [Planctomycetaceae bacterium]|nr:histidinol-phosphate transaminase [Planctomycetaceae bacterium]